MGRRCSQKIINAKITSVPFTKNPTKGKRNKRRKWRFSASRIRKTKTYAADCRERESEAQTTTSFDAGW